MPRTLNIPSEFKDYRGAGHAVLAIEADGTPIAAVYYDDLMTERSIKAQLEKAHPSCTTAAGMMSCYEFNAFENFTRIDR